MSVTEKLEKALNDFMDEINERLDTQKTMVLDVDKLVEHAFGAGAKAAAKLIKNAETSSMRDAMAAHALGGILSHHGGTEGDFPMIARDAYQIADAMLKEREK